VIRTLKIATGYCGRKVALMLFNHARPNNNVYSQKLDTPRGLRQPPAGAELPKRC
jgi:hypothetical protein